MQLAPLQSAPRIGAPTAPAPILASLHYVMRGPRGEVREAQIDAQADPGSQVIVRGPFDDALRAARERARAAHDDGIHRGAISQAQGIVDAGDGAWRVVALVGDHRDAIGPLFIDGPFYDKVGLAVHGRRVDRALQAIVGADRWMDLRGPLRAPAVAIPSVPVRGRIGSLRD